MRRRWSLATAGLFLILAGGLTAHLTQTSGGIRIEDIRFKGAKGNSRSAGRSGTQHAVARSSPSRTSRSSTSARTGRSRRRSTASTS